METLVSDFDFSVIAEDCESSDGQSRYIIGQVKEPEDTTASER